VFLLVPLMLLSGCKSKTDTPVPDGSPSASAIAGVQTFGGLSQKHLGKGEYDITYPQSPPVGGAHSPVWLKCQAYRDELPKVNAVHSLEHGGVWITYPPGTAQATVSQLEQYVGTNKEYVLVSPYAGQGSPVVVTAWGAQLTLASPTDPRLLQFVQAYAGHGPEQGVTCASSGATLEQALQFDAQQK
jgi:hypothetical protein